MVAEWLLIFQHNISVDHVSGGVTNSRRNQRCGDGFEVAAEPNL